MVAGSFINRDLILTFIPELKEHFLVKLIFTKTIMNNPIKVATAICSVKGKLFFI
jgi:hypothetical protein